MESVLGTLLKKNLENRKKLKFLTPQATAITHAKNSHVAKRVTWISFFHGSTYTGNGIFATFFFPLFHFTTWYPPNYHFDQSQNDQTKQYNTSKYTTSNNKRIWWSRARWGLKQCYNRNKWSFFMVCQKSNFVKTKSYIFHENSIWKNWSFSRHKHIKIRVFFGKIKNFRYTENLFLWSFFTTRQISHRDIEDIQIIFCPCDRAGNLALFVWNKN